MTEIIKGYLSHLDLIDSPPHRVLPQSRQQLSRAGRQAAQDERRFESPCGAFRGAV